MKKLLFILLIASAFAIDGHSQGKNSIRISGGVCIVPNTKLEDNYSLHIGPAISIAYARSFNRFIAAESEVYCALANHSNTAHSGFADFSLKAMVTPLGNIFKYLEIGIGPSVRYQHFTLIHGERDMEDEGFISCSWTEDREYIELGINYCILLYAIRNNRFDLFGFYEPRTNFSPDFRYYYWASSNAGIAFGVKF